MKSVAFHNLGCKVNSYELDVMQQMLEEKGYKIVPFDQIADIYIINTCTVTNIADRKSRQMLHRAKKNNPESIVVAVGCYVQTEDAEALKEDGIDLCIGNNRIALFYGIRLITIKLLPPCGNSYMKLTHICDYFNNRFNNC